MMKFILEYDCEMIGIFDRKEDAMFEAYKRCFDEMHYDYDYKCEDFVADMYMLATQGRIDGFIYIIEVPYYAAGGNV